MAKETNTTFVPFLFEGNGLIRAVRRDEEPWFAAADVCHALGIKQATRAVEALDNDEKGVSSVWTPGGVQELWTISEGGLYALIMRTRAAMTQGTVQHRFRKWVTGEVLPQIRKTGSYQSASDRARLAQQRMELRAKRAEVQAMNARTAAMNAASRTAEMVYRSNGRQTAALAIRDIYGTMGIKIDLTVSDAFLQAELPFNGAN